MHPSSMKNMERVKAKHLQHIGEGAKVLDVGGRGRKYDRSYGKLFPDVERYDVADIVDGPGVSHVMSGPYELPFIDDFYDLIVSGQTLEHVPNPFRLVSEMKRVLKPGGRIVIIVPSAGPRHDEKDYWRFMDDAFEAVCEDCGLTMIANWISRDAPDQRSRKWADNVFVGTK